MMRAKYKIIRDTQGQRGGYLLSPHTYTLNKEFGDRLVNEGRAINYGPKRMVTVQKADNTIVTMSWGEYLKEKRKVL